MMCFFFCKQKTAYELRISDWSSDVCSSDLRSLRGSFVDILGAQRGIGEHRHQMRLHFEDAATDGERQHLAVRCLHAQRARLEAGQRAEESRVGKEGVRTCRSRWSPNH